MKILYVTSFWSGFKDIIFDGKEEATGMPAFIYPLKKLIELGNQVDIVVIVQSPKHTLKIIPEWLKNSRFYLVSWRADGILRIPSALRLYIYVKNLLRHNKYDFIYGHGSVGSIGCLAAYRYGLPCGQRLYGTFLAEEVSKKSRYYIALKHPLEYMAFRTPKSFLLITNDGTRGNYVYKRLAGKAKYDFYFLLNGADIPNSNLIGNVPKQKDAPLPYLFFPARIARWKQQHLAIDILKHLHDKGLIGINLYFAGHISDTDYWTEIKLAAKKKGLEQFVAHLGELGRQKLFKYMNNSIAVLSLYQVSNLGNVVIEALSAGALVLSLDDGSLVDIIEDGANGILVTTAEEAAERIEGLLKEPDQTALIRRRARELSVKQFLSWDNRAMKEVYIIERSVRSASLQIPAQNF